MESRYVIFATFEREHWMQVATVLAKNPFLLLC